MRGLVVNVYAYETDRAVRRVADTLGALQADVRRAAKNALNRTMRFEQTDIIRELRREYNVPAQELRKRLYVHRAKKGDLRCWILAQGRVAVPLIRYSPQPSSPAASRAELPQGGVSVLVKRTEGRKVVKGSFIQDTGAGAQIYKRVGDERYPVRLLYGPSYLRLLGEQMLWEERRSRSVQRFGEMLQHEAESTLRKAGLR
jgi:hypothetical protein